MIVAHSPLFYKNLLVEHYCQPKSTVFSDTNQLCPLYSRSAVLGQFSPSSPPTAALAVSPHRQLCSSPVHHHHHPAISPGVEVSCVPPTPSCCGRRYVAGLSPPDRPPHRRQQQQQHGAWLYSPCHSPSALSPLVSPTCSPTRHRPSFPPYLPVFPASPSSSCLAACCLSPLGRPSTPAGIRSLSPSELHPITFSSSPGSPDSTSAAETNAADASCFSLLVGGSGESPTCPLCQPGAAQLLLCPPAAINFQFALLARPARDHNGRVTAEYFREGDGGSIKVLFS